MTKILSALAAVLFFAGAASAQCDLPGGLFARKMKLNNESLGSRGREEREIEQTYLAIVDSISKGYATGNTAFVNDCCSRAEKDPVIRLTCVMTNFLQSGRKESSSFIDGFPDTKEEARALWILDNVGGKNVLSNPSGFYFKFMEELHALAIGGNDKALDRFLSFIEFTDGGAAEYISDKNMVMFLDHPDFVLKQWPTFKKHREMLVSMPEYLSEASLKTILKNLEPLCKKDKAFYEYIKRTFEEGSSR